MMVLYLVIAYYLNITRRGTWFCAELITDGTLDGDPAGSKDGTILKPLLSTRDHNKRD